MSRLVGSSRWGGEYTPKGSIKPVNKKVNVLLIAVNDDMFKTNYTKYLEEVEDKYDSHLFVFGTGVREVTFNDQGLIDEVRGGIGGEQYSDQVNKFYAENQEVEFEEDEDNEVDYDEEIPVFRGGIREEYALYDAINSVITTAVRRCDNINDNVIITIVTDRAVDFGSIDNGRSDINELISKCQNEYGWTFNFLCKEKDAYDEAVKLGIKGSRSANYTSCDEAISTICSMLQ